MPEDGRFGLEIVVIGDRLGTCEDCGKIVEFERTAMRALCTLMLLIGWILFGSLESASGQLIRIFSGGGGTSIRVPFVRVETDPVFGTYVRAPLVEINSPPRFGYGYRAYPGRVYPGTVYPGPRYGLGPVYPPVSPAPANAPGQPVAPAAATPTPNINGPDPTGNPPNPSGLNSVLSLDAGPTMDFQQQRRALLDSAQALDRGLSRYSNAQEWQEFLRLPEFLTAPAAHESAADLANEQREQLRDLLKRFDKVSQRSDYRLVNQLEPFRATHLQLSQLSQLVFATGQSQPAREELPPPIDKN